SLRWMQMQYLQSAGCLEDLEQFRDHALALLGIFAADGGYHTAVEMPGQDKAVELVQRALDRLGLVEYVTAVGIVFDYPLNPAHMAFDGLEPVQQLVFVSVHLRVSLCVSSHPLPRGMGLVYLSMPCLSSMFFARHLCDTHAALPMIRAHMPLRIASW